MHIPIAQPSLGNEESDAVLAVLASGMIAQGPVTAAFEDESAAYCGVPHAVAVSNGTTALHAALLAAGVGPGDEVIVRVVGDGHQTPSDNQDAEKRLSCSSSCGFPPGAFMNLT